ncbi:MAG: NAD-dependent epimerase/dehydratase family protein [Rhodospirillaceae bacterium]|nr:NAD-dependent epimerase/dehydratase family protein [Rhodospirillaceae bacterium]
MDKVIVTGGAGFIGSRLVGHLLEETDYQVVNLDKITYAAVGRPVALNEAAPDTATGDAGRYQHDRIDICDQLAVRSVFERFQPDAVFHLAAETHVDRSLDAPTTFFETNVRGSFVLLQEATRYWSGLTAEARDRFRLILISTDEVFGTVSGDGRFDHKSPYRPNSPYAATKAAADHLARAWHVSMGLPVIFTHACNNFGPYQLPDKLIPRIITRAILGQELPIYGNGLQEREWIWVDDHVRGLMAASKAGQPGAHYLFGGSSARTNLSVARDICSRLDDLLPQSIFRPHNQLIKFVVDRPGHDQRYAVDSSRALDELSWSPKMSFEDGLARTLLWHLDNRPWWEAHLQEADMSTRIGLDNPAVASQQRTGGSVQGT